MRWSIPVILVSALLAGCLDGDEGQREPAQDMEPEPVVPEVRPFVVVATLDTGTNPLHPAFIRDQPHHPSLLVPGYPEGAGALHLVRGAEQDFVSDVENSTGLSALMAKQWPMWVPGTNLIGLWSHESDAVPVFDVEAALQEDPGGHYHGGPASSQIAGTGFGIAEDAYLVIMDRTTEGPDGVGITRANEAGLRWAADQSWIDIIHTNIQSTLPMSRYVSDADPIDFFPDPTSLAYAVAAGKLVISAGGNFRFLFTETSPHTGPIGVLAVGANDNCGYTDYSNPDPHVVMDGVGTVAAEASGYGETTFGGTSASPRTTGYAAQLLLEVRRAVGDMVGFQDGHLVVLAEGVAPPPSGPLADGRLHASELHEVIRKTADPNPHDSKWDGAQGTCIPQPADSPVAVYPKMGYGEVSEHTFALALDVLLGHAPIPERPAEDAFFGFSQTVRETLW